MTKSETYIKLKPLMTWNDLLKLIESIPEEYRNEGVTAQHDGMETSYTLGFAVRDPSLRDKISEAYYLSCEYEDLLTEEEFQDQGFGLDMIEHQVCFQFEGPHRKVVDA